MKISVIIPVYNEVDRLHYLLDDIRLKAANRTCLELIISDGGSNDGTLDLSELDECQVIHAQKGRGNQLFQGALAASGEILFFVHADTILPNHFDSSISHAIDSGKLCGCFRLKFHPSSIVLNLYTFFTRFGHILFRGGDQTLFVERNLYHKAGGFNRELNHMEDIDIIKRLKQYSKFYILPHHVITSSRRYIRSGIISLQWHYAVMHLKFILKRPNEELESYYEKNIG